MTRDLLAYGVTTYSVTPGASAFAAVSNNTYVVGRYLFAGATTGFYTGGTAAAATLAAALVPIPSVGIYIPGPAPLALLGANPLYVTTYLSQGATISQGY